MKIYRNTIRSIAKSLPKTRIFHTPDRDQKAIVCHRILAETPYFTAGSALL